MYVFFNISAALFSLDCLKFTSRCPKSTQTRISLTRRFLLHSFEFITEIKKIAATGKLLLLGIMLAATRGVGGEL